MTGFTIKQFWGIWTMDTLLLVFWSVLLFVFPFHLLGKTVVTALLLFSVFLFVILGSKLIARYEELEAQEPSCDPQREDRDVSFR